MSTASTTTAGLARVLVVLDYSGTLSTGAVRFAQPRSLARSLQGSGLAALGVTDPPTFWTRVVDPTWQAGSTGGSSYAECVALGVRALNPQADPEMARAAAERFARAYLEASSIDDGWGPLLADLAGDRGLSGVIATDHYREATPKLLEELERLGSSGRRIGDVGPASSIAVANSADLGGLKTTGRFWRAVRSDLASHGRGFERVVVIDDFGANEMAEDDYSAKDLTQARRERVESLLASVLRTEVQSLTFALPSPSHAGPAERSKAEVATFVGEARRLLGRLARRSQSGHPRQE